MPKLTQTTWNLLKPFLSFLVLLYVSGRFKQKKFFEFFFQLTDSQKSRIRVVYLQNFSISRLKKNLKKFFCLKRPETQSKTKKLKKFNIFFKIKVSPLFCKKHL